MSTLETDIRQAVEDILTARGIIVADAGIMDAIANGPAAGDDSQVMTANGLVKTAARAIAELIDGSAYAGKDLANVDDSAVRDVIRRLMMVESATVSAPPGSPSDGLVYLVPVGATGGWAGEDGKIAVYDSGWTYLTPSIGWTAYSKQTDVLYTYSTGGWVAATPAPASITLAQIAGIDAGGMSVSAKAWAKLPGLYKLRSGGNFGSYDSTRLYCNPGMAASANGQDVVSWSLQLCCDITTSGVTEGGTPPGGAMSTTIGGMLGGSVPPVSTTDLHWYLIRKTANGDLALCASAYRTYGEVIPYMPSGWAMIRKMDFNVVYATGRGALWNGLPNFFNDIDGNWTELTGATNDSNYRLLNEGPNTGDTIVGCATYVGDLSRRLRVKCLVEGVSAAGYAEIAPNGTNSWFPVGWVESGGKAWSEHTVKLDSQRRFKYRVSTSGVRLSVWIMGYMHDDPT